MARHTRWSPYRHVFGGEMRLPGCWTHPHSASPGKRRASCKGHTAEVGGVSAAAECAPYRTVQCSELPRAGNVRMGVGLKEGNGQARTSFERCPTWECLSLNTSQVRQWALAPPLGTSSPSGARHSAGGQRAGRQAGGRVWEAGDEGEGASRRMAGQATTGARPHASCHFQWLHSRRAPHSPAPGRSGARPSFM
jgi:hypothetical protein